MKQVEKAFEWTQVYRHGRPYWHKDYPGKGHARITHRDGMYETLMVCIRNSDGYDVIHPEYVDNYSTLREAQDSMDALFAGFNFSYVGAVTHRL